MTTLTLPRIQQAHDRALIGIVASLTVLFLYAATFQIANYDVTIGGIFVPIVLLYSLRRNKFYPYPFLFGVFFLGWPLVIMVASSFTGASLTPDPFRFITSYALWAISILLLMEAFLSQSPVQVRWVLPIQIILAILMAIQFIGPRFFSNWIGFEIVAPLFANDIFHSYLGLNFESSVRAIGTYYEPSMCARVMGTLCFIDLIRTGRILRNLVFLGLTLLFTQSLGLVVMTITLGGITLGLSWRQFGMMLIAGGLLSIIAVPIVSRRGSIEQGSTYVRVVAPITTLKWSVTNHIFGLPIGSMGELAIKTGYVQQTGEEKITNGIYEFLIYFGFIGIAIFIAACIFTFALFVSGERELSAALAYLILSTGLSGSFLSIESSLLTYFFLVCAREVRQLRLGKRTRLRSTSERHLRPMAGHLLVRRSAS